MRLNVLSWAFWTKLKTKTFLYSFVFIRSIKSIILRKRRKMCMKKSATRSETTRQKRENVCSTIGSFLAGKRKRSSFNWARFITLFCFSEAYKPPVTPSPSNAGETDQKKVRTKLMKLLMKRPTLQSVKEKGYIRGEFKQGAKVCWFEHSFKRVIYRLYFSQMFHHLIIN